MIAWSPVLPPALLAVAVLGIAVALWWQLRELRLRVGAAAVSLWWPRAALGLLLLLTLAGPRWRFEDMRPPGGPLTVIVDTSSSMDLRDGQRSTRLERARRIAARIRDAVPSGIPVEILAGDTRIRGPLPDQLPAGERPGDPAAILAGLAQDPRLSGRSGCVLISDGGDEPIAIGQAPGCPLWVVGVGPPAGAVPDDVAVADLDTPASAEIDFEVPLNVELSASGSAGFLARLGAVPAVLEEEQPGGWHEVARELVDLRGGRARTSFTRRWPEPGSVQLRLRVPPQAGEASELTNQREATIEVRRRGLHVLFFTREIGAEFKALRQELGRDPGLTFTALLRTVASNRQGDRYALLGERLDGDAALERGFPTDASGLARYGVVIVGAFAPEAWRADEAEALRQHAERGAGVLFLAGEDCAAGGGLAALAPCPPGGNLERGSFPLAVPGAAAGHPAVDGLAGLLAGSAVQTVRRVGRPRPGASQLLTAGGMPLLTVQGYGRGRSALIASNTLWRLAGPGPAGDGYGRLWRQLTRWLAGSADEGGLLRVRWDKDRYRPGEEAVATILPNAAANLSLRATLAPPDGQPQVVALSPAPDEGAGAQHARLRLSERGAWHFRVEGLRDGQPVDAVERVLSVAPRLGEGARLIPDHAAMERAAQAAGGAYASEAEADDLAQRIATGLAGAPVIVERAPLASPWLLLLVLALLAIEWTMRRKAGIV
jgi:hypothetical protein